MLGSNIGLAVTNLMNSHNVVGIAPYTKGTVAYAPNPLDQINPLPGRSIPGMVTFGWAPRR